MPSKKRERMRLRRRNNVTVVDLGEMEIWDGADLALLRETLTRLIDHDGCDAVGIEMAYVKYIPSGFFGMLCDWHDRGSRMCLFSPQPNVARMLWFRRFFQHTDGDCFTLNFKLHENKPVKTLDWANDTDRVHPFNSNGAVTSAPANGHGSANPSLPVNSHAGDNIDRLLFRPEDLDRINSE